MKKVGVILGVFITVMAVVVFVNKLYYPSLPINGISAAEAINRMKESDRKVAEITVEEDSTWYITRSGGKGISIADENIKQMISSKGWEFKEKDGSGLFFERKGDKLIATTQMWTKNYVLIKIPNKFSKS